MELIHRSPEVVQSQKWGPNFTVPTSRTEFSALQDYEYVVVGSGAGGGPLAARLARRGFSVLLIEAGSDQGALLQERIPAAVNLAAEVQEMRWDFYVSRYLNGTRAAQDYKMVWQTPGGQRFVGLNPPNGSAPLGNLYPRAGTLGGCAVHNQLLSIYPHKSDWDYIANITGDSTWSADSMRQYFERLERNEYLPQGTAGHGFDGWLGISTASTRTLFADQNYLSQGIAAMTTLGKAAGKAVTSLNDFLALLNPDINSDSTYRDCSTDAFPMALAIQDNERSSPRQIVVDTAGALYPNGSRIYRLDIQLNTLATRVQFAGNVSRPRATGVQFLEGQSLYRADPRSNLTTGGVPGSVRATREVIISAGAFNTPQLLKLSGIGPAEELHRLQIPVVVDLPGVGMNLQDRYETSIIGESNQAYSVSGQCKLLQGVPDPCFEQYKQGQGFYTTQGGGLGITMKSSVSEGDNDLMLFNSGRWFSGYFPGFATYRPGNGSYFTWKILEGHTRNRAGTVRLRSADPRDTPEINFNYFDSGTTESGADQRDLQVIYEGFKHAREIFHQAQAGNSTAPFHEVFPGPDVSTKEEIERFIMNNAWGHHASCSCPIGADDDKNAVLDSRFRVRGADGLRVVDTSVFPKIPGLFIAVPTYMISEKAADVIIEDAQAPVAPVY